MNTTHDFDFLISDLNDKTHIVSKMGVREEVDDSGVSSTAGFRKAPFTIYGDSTVSEFDQIMAKIRKRAEETDTSIVSFCVSLLRTYQVWSE